MSFFGQSALRHWEHAFRTASRDHTHVSPKGLYLTEQMLHPGWPQVHTFWGSTCLADDRDGIQRLGFRGLEDTYQALRSPSPAPSPSPYYLSRWTFQHCAG